MYKVIEDSRGEKREFSITCGLSAKYSGVKTSSVQAAYDIIIDWMKSRASQNQSYFTGKVFVGDVLYAWPEEEGAIQSAIEPIIEFTGEVSPSYNSELSDDNVTEILNELAGVLGTALDQTRIYVSYKDVVWCLQSEWSETPTGESA